MTQVVAPAPEPLFLKFQSNPIHKHSHTHTHTLQTVLNVWPLESGRSSQVTGRVAVLRREPLLAIVGGGQGTALPPGEEELFYRLSEATSLATYIPQLVPSLRL